MIHLDTSVLFDLGVSGCALTCGAALWTLNADDFRDIPGLGLFEA